jgi:hypothetical protein
MYLHIVKTKKCFTCIRIKYMLTQGVALNKSLGRTKLKNVDLYVNGLAPKAWAGVPKTRSHFSGYGEMFEKLKDVQVFLAHLHMI